MSLVEPSESEWMTAEQLWQAMVKRNQKLANPDAEVTIKVEQLHRLIDQAHTIGAAHAREIGSTLDTMLKRMGLGD